MISVIYQNIDFVIVDKPAGLDFHTKRDEETSQEPQTQPGLAVSVQNQLQQPVYPVHRLDKMTSGLVIFARTVDAAQRFQVLFQQRLVEKYYLAISTHQPKKKQGWIKGDMVPARRGNWKLTPSIVHPAITQFISENLRPKERWYLLKPHTGKTHQLRVALKSLGAPISGDLRYEAVASAQVEERGYLHAYALRFTDQGEHYEFVLNPKQGERFLTAEGQQQLLKWQAPWQHFKTKEKK